MVREFLSNLVASIVAFWKEFQLEVLDEIFVSGLANLSLNSPYLRKESLTFPSLDTQLPGARIEDSSQNASASPGHL
uniref:Uncharacterized protein n=1 Tax=Steinernema glaseri TaxID=37863 RepID=A0A1I7ZS71_9BILA